MELRTPRLRLREFVEGDAVFTNAYESDAEVVRYQSHGPQSLDESVARVRSSIAASIESPRVVFDFAVVVHSEARLVGRCGFKITSIEQREAMLWYVVDRSEWGKGYITEAARAVVQLAFEVVGLHRIFVDVDPRNGASLRVAEKLGMRREARFLENMWLKGEWTDSVIMAILDREYRAR